MKIAAEQIIFYLLFIFSLTLHELTHAFIAFRLGDRSQTVRDRITINPIKHIDIWGSVLLPIMLLLSNSGFIFGWAKPVTVNAQSFKSPYRDMAITGAAGPVSNLMLAALGLLILKLFAGFFTASNVAFSSIYIFIMLNALLFAFNMLPVPPLDGAKLIAYMLPETARKQYIQYGPYAMIIVFLLMLSGVLNPFLMLINNIIKSVI